MLTAEQIHLFRHNGYLKLPVALPPDRVASLREAVWRDIREEKEPVARDQQGRVVRISAIWERGGVFCESLAAPELLDALESLLGPNVELILNRHNHATLRLGGDGSDYFHRDVLQWTRTIVTVIFYLEDTTVENGCTLMVPGSHLLPGVPSLDLGSEESIRRSGILEQAVPVPMPAGGMLAIDSMVMHSAGRNQTAGTRMSLTAGYHSVDELFGLDHPARVLLRGQRIYHGNDRRAG